MTFTLIVFLCAGILIRSSSFAILLIYGLHRKHCVEITLEHRTEILHFELIKTIFKQDSAIRNWSGIMWRKVLCTQAYRLSDFQAKRL
jgi:hypothetical protein